jgi:WD40 repeat protein
MQKLVEARRKEELEARRKAEERRIFLSQTLPARAVKDASYDAQGKIPCDNDTRVNILEDIKNWIYDVSADSQSILWLTGPPGSGKSAVTASIARECKNDKILWAQFFINRNSPETTNPKSFFPSIAHQLADHYSDSDVALAIHDALKKKPSLMDDISLDQAGGLFVDAMAVASKLDLSKPVVVVVDGLDETDRLRLRETAQILSAIFEALHPNAKLLISSRTDDEIQKSFAVTLDVKHVKHVHLETSSSIEDVSNFLTRKIAWIVKQNDLDWMEWPGVERMEMLCAQAAGLFIWAATATKFIQEQLDTSGRECLDVVLNTLNINGMDDINSLYGTILRLTYPQTSEPWVFERFRKVLGCIVVLREPLSIADIRDLLDLRQAPTRRPADIEHLVRRFRTVLVTGTQAVNDQTIPQLHKSFFEFITSERAETRFRVERNISNGELAIRCLRQLVSLHSRHVSDKDFTIASLSGPLRYALRFWTSHICRADVTIAGMVVTDSDIPLSELRKLLQTSFNCSDARPLVAGFSLDRTRILTSWNNVIRDWNAASGWPTERLQAFKGHTGSVNSVGFSPDGKLIVSGSDDSTIRFWDSQTGQPIGTPFKGHTGLVNSVAFSPDGKSIVSGSHDSTIRFLDSQSGKSIGTPFKGHTKTVSSVAFSPDGKSIVSGSWDKTIRLWDSQSGKSIGTPFKGHTDLVNSVAFSPDGKSIVSGSHDSTIRFLDSQSGKSIRTPFEGHTETVSSVAFSPDGKSIVSGSWDKTIRLWDSQRGKSVGTPFKGHTGSVLSVAFSPDGKSIVSGSADRTIRLWDSQSGQSIGSPFKGHTESVLSVAFSPDGKLIVSGGVGDTIRLWDSQSGRPIIPLPFGRHMKWVTSTIFSADATHVVSTSKDNTIRFLDSKTGLLEGLPLTDKYVKDVVSIAVSPDGTQMLRVLIYKESSLIWGLAVWEKLINPLPCERFFLTVGILSVYIFELGCK